MTRDNLVSPPGWRLWWGWRIFTPWAWRVLVDRVGEAEDGFRRTIGAQNLELTNRSLRISLLEEEIRDLRNALALRRDFLWAQADGKDPQIEESWVMRYQDTCSDGDRELKDLRATVTLIGITDERMREIYDVGRCELRGLKWIARGFSVQRDDRGGWGERAGVTRGMSTVEVDLAAYCAT